MCSSSWSLGMPNCTKSSNIFGSISSKAEGFSKFGLGGVKTFVSRWGIIDCGACWDTWGAEEERWPDNKLLIPPNKPCDLPCAWSPPDGCVSGPKPWKGVNLVCLLALFSLSSIFFLNCLASFSSMKESPAKPPSSSNEWKKVLSWL